MTETLGAREAGGAVEIEVVARLDWRPGNVAVTHDGRVLVSAHPFPYGGVHRYRVLELTDDGSERPFPNEEWATAPDADGVGLVGVIGLQADQNGVAWLLDSGLDAGGGEGSLPRIVAWDTRRGELLRVVHVPAHAVRPNSFQQDLAVDLVHRAVFIADMTRGDLFGESRPSIVTVDLDTGEAWRALEGHETLQPEQDAALVIEGRTVRSVGPDGEPAEFRLGLNPIAMDPAYEWVYYGSVNGTKVFRVRAADLLDRSLAVEELGRRVELYGEKRPSDGISIDGAGNVYVTDVCGNAIGVTRPDGSYEVLVRDDERLIWPDGLAYGPDGYLYCTVSQLHRAAALNEGTDDSEPPFEIVRFRSLAPGTVGR